MALPVGYDGASQMRGRFRIEEGDRVAVRWRLSAIYNGKPLNNQSRSLPDAKLIVLSRTVVACVD